MYSRIELAQCRVPLWHKYSNLTDGMEHGYRVISHYNSLNPDRTTWWNEDTMTLITDAGKSLLVIHRSYYTQSFETGSHASKPDDCARGICPHAPGSAVEVESAGPVSISSRFTSGCEDVWDSLLVRFLRSLDLASVRIFQV